MKWVKSPNGVTEEHTNVNASELVRLAGWTYVIGATEKDTPDERPIGDTTPVGELVGVGKADADVVVDKPVEDSEADVAVDDAEGEAAVEKSEGAVEKSEAAGVAAPKKGKRG